eukprot:39387-Eustigmatos_ZCMA.PRE.1
MGPPSLSKGPVQILSVVSPDGCGSMRQVCVWEVYIGTYVGRRTYMGRGRHPPQESASRAKVYCMQSDVVM